jgi:uncharacterized membrane protein
MALQEFCQWLQNVGWAASLRESEWVFPIVEGTHVIALSLSVGTILMMDLRLAGILFRKERVSDISNQLMPYALTGFSIMFVTGILLFCSQALKAYGSVWFQLKLVFLLLAGINAAAFELTLRRRVTEWDTAETPPFRARLAGILGIILWTGVIAAGRTMAYNF